MLSLKLIPIRRRCIASIVSFLNIQNTTQFIFQSLLFYLSLTFTVSCIANSDIGHFGSGFTNGGTALPNHLLSALHNPASGMMMLRPDDNWRMGYWAGISLAAEFGDVDNFEDEINDLIDTLEDDNVSQDEADEVITRFDDILVELGEEGYLRVDIHSQIPVFPMVFRIDATPGVWTVDWSIDAQIWTSFLDDPLSYVNESFQTNSSVYLKSANWHRASLAYSQPIWKGSQPLWPNSTWNVSGQLLFGARLNVYSMSLTKQVIGVDNLDDDEELADVIKDEYDQNEVDSTDVSVDVGVIWLAEKYHLGLTVSNLNEPEFEYGDVAVNCDDSSLTTTAASNCYTAEFFVDAGEITASEVHKMSSVMTLDGSWFIFPQWNLSFSYDLADYNNPIGDLVQLFTVSSNHMPHSSWLPGWRIGYRSNLVGTEIESYSFGLSMAAFKFDLFMAKDKTDIDGSSYPRAAGLAFSFEQRY